MTCPPEERSQDDLVAKIVARANALYSNKELSCSEAIAVAFHEAIDTGLPAETVRGMTAAYPGGMGEAGCVCGALSGAALMLGIYLSPGMSPAKIREASRRLHDEFKDQFGATCCRVLTKKVKDDPKARLTQCRVYTTTGAELACRIILTAVPELVRSDKLSDISRPFPRFGRLLRRISRFFG